MDVNSERVDINSYLLTLCNVATTASTVWGIE